MAGRQGKDETVTEVMTDRELGKAGQAPGTDLVPAKFSREDLGLIDSFDAAVALAMGVFGDVLNAADEPLFGDGFKVMTDEDKRNLKGKPLLLLDWRFLDSEYGSDGDKYVVAHAIQRLDNGGVKKWVITDGSTGIARDLKNYTDKTGRDGGVLFSGGIRASDYQTDAETGTPLSKSEVREYMVKGRKMAPGHTFYLDA